MEVIFGESETFNSSNNKNYIKFNSVEVLGQNECEKNKGIFASDHYGLCCEIDINYEIDK